MKEYRHITSDPEIEIRENGDGGYTIEGYAAMFNSLSKDLGGYQEIIKPGAFDRTLREISEGRVPDVFCRVQHERGLSTVGRCKNGTLRLKCDSKGLRYSCDTPNTNTGRDIVQLVSRGDIDRSSFAFSVSASGYSWLDLNTDHPTRVLTDIDLYDVAPVDDPAYEATSVKMRAMIADELQEARASVGDKQTYQTEKEDELSDHEIRVMIQEAISVYRP